MLLNTLRLLKQESYLRRDAKLSGTCCPAIFMATAFIYIYDMLQKQEIPAPNFYSKETFDLLLVKLEPFVKKSILVFLVQQSFSPT